MATQRTCLITTIIFLLQAIITTANPVPTPAPNLADRQSPPQTVYTYTTQAAAHVIEPLFGIPDDCSGIVGKASDCPFGCTAYALPALLGINFAWSSCVAPSPVTVYSDIVATSTCPPGETVKIFHPYGVTADVPKCAATD